jgi:hypothetical protein
MNDDRQARILTALRELFDAIAEEVRSNPSFAAKVQASLASAAGTVSPPAGTVSAATGTLSPAAEAISPPPGKVNSPTGTLSPPIMSVLRHLPELAAASPAPPPGTAAKDNGKANKLLHNITFDPLECHVEAALLSGREQEVRTFLGKLDRWQLEEVVKAQRLPGTRNLQKAIFEGDTPSAVEAIVGSAFERIRSRLSTAR